MNKERKSAVEILDECGILHSNNIEWDNGESLRQLRNAFFSFLDDELCHSTQITDFYEAQASNCYITKSDASVDNITVSIGSAA